MKKLVLALVLMMAAAPAYAGWNLNFWGSNDKQKKNHNKHHQEDPVNVPEPATLILLALGGAAIATGKAVDGRRR